MKKIAILIALMTLTLILSACNNSTVTMDNIDEYLDQENTMYVDIRNYDEINETGYIEGFTILPLYDLFEVEGIIIRSNGYTFTPNDIWKPDTLRSYFDEDKTIYIMCRSGNRAEYFVSVLKYLGYEDVHNIGGIIDYKGDHLIRETIE
ncbi:MAG: rhodanese-like domain-containing protein [Candidatus Izemoplasmataceae bacterium]